MLELNKDKISNCLSVIDNLNREESLNYLFNEYFNNILDISLRKFLLRIIIRYMNYDKNVLDKYKLSLVQEDIILNSLYSYKYENLDSLKRILDNLFLIDGDNLSLNKKVIDDYIELLKIILNNKTKQQKSFINRLV